MNYVVWVFVGVIVILSGFIGMLIWQERRKSVYTAALEVRYKRDLGRSQQTITDLMAQNADLQEALSDAQTEIKRWQQQTEPMQLEQAKPAPKKRISRKAASKNERVDTEDTQLV